LSQELKIKVQNAPIVAFLEVELGPLCGNPVCQGVYHIILVHIEHTVKVRLQNNVSKRVVFIKGRAVQDIHPFGLISSFMMAVMRPLAKRLGDGSQIWSGAFRADELIRL
jgi:hypothetical protein